MRGAGCTWNDLTDRKFDAQVARTRSRPLPSGQVTPHGAAVWMCVQGLLAFGILLTFNTTAIVWGIASLAIVAIYPFAKRFTWWPQVFLGLAFNWGALLLWVAVEGEIGWPAILLYVSGIAWTLHYDTIYAHQDREDDALIGVRSTARLFGTQTRGWLWAFIAVSGLTAGCAAVLAGGGALSLIGLAGFFVHLGWQARSVEIDDPDGCLRLFRSNRDAGLILLAGLCADVVFLRAPLASASASPQRLQFCSASQRVRAGSRCCGLRGRCLHGAAAPGFPLALASNPSQRKRGLSQIRRRQLRWSRSASRSRSPASSRSRPSVISKTRAPCPSTRRDHVLLNVSRQAPIRVPPSQSRAS